MDEIDYNKEALTRCNGCGRLVYDDECVCANGGGEVESCIWCDGQDEVAAPAVRGGRDERWLQE